MIDVVEQVIERHPEVKNEGIPEVLDTNVLLLPYKIDLENLGKILEVYRNLSGQGRLFVPGQVAREFARHRDSKLTNIIATLENFKSDLSVKDKKKVQILEEEESYKAYISAYDKIKDGIKEAQRALSQLVASMERWNGDDPVTKAYSNIFTENIVVDIDLEEKHKIEIKADLEYRYSHDIPPGFKDSSKPDMGIGDFVIWRTILALGEREKKDLIFVSGEEKNDWFVRSNGRPIYPRYAQASPHF